jgi:membrane protease YdiL (CAAX protease family)
MSDTRRTYAFFLLACGITWALAMPTALAWMDGRAPSPGAIAGAGLSAFGPLIAALALALAGPRGQLREVFGRWRTNPAWILLALCGFPLLHVAATAVYVAIGGQPAQWFYPPRTPQAIAALVVFPLGEEFGWRGFAHPRMVARFGPVKGCLIVGGVWGLWHLAYSASPDAAGFDLFGFALLLVELPLCAVIIGWVFERANRSMAVAIAFHASAHLDNFQRAPRTDLRLQISYVLVVAAAAGIAGWALSRRAAPAPGGAAGRALL